MPLLPASLTRTAILTETTSSLATSPLLGRQLQQLLKSPVVVKQTMPTGAVTAGTKPVGATIDAELTAVNDSPARNQDPVLITGQGVVNTFGIIPLPSEMLFTEAAPDLRSGPSIENSLANDKASVAKPAAAPLPLLITAQNGFSADMLRPMSSKPVFPPNPNSGAPVVTVDNANLSAVDGSYCDPNFQGQPIRFSQTVELKLEDLLNQLNSRFGVNFIIGPGIAQLPLNVKAGSIPWNVLLRSQLFLSGVRARCIDANTVELVKNKDLPELQDMADVKTRFIKLKFLQRTSSGTVDLANRSQGGGQNSSQGGCAGAASGQSSGSAAGGGAAGASGPQTETAAKQNQNKFDKLIQEIEKILGIRSMTQSSSGNGSDSNVARTEEKRTNRSVTEVPGRNILVVKATEDEFALIDEIIKRADRPPFQVVVKGLVYTANQTLLRDIGVQSKITTVGTSDTKGSILGHTLGDAGGTLFNFSSILGTVDFNVQATAFQENGVISIKSRPFATVLDGLCTTLDVGPSLPIVIDSNILGGQGSVTFVNAANNLSVTPYVLDDDAGNPMAVTLDLRLTANTIDNTVVTRGVPNINQRSVQTQLLLGEDKTAILGGFTVDQNRKNIFKTPGLGDIPLIGNLFKRRIQDTQLSRLYFAISVSVIPFGDAIAPVAVPGATTDPPSITPEMKKRADKAEPKQVVDPK